MLVLGAWMCAGLQACLNSEQAPANMHTRGSAQQGIVPLLRTSAWSLRECRTAHTCKGVVHLEEPCRLRFHSSWGKGGAEFEKPNAINTSASPRTTGFHLQAYMKALEVCLYQSEALELGMFQSEGNSNVSAHQRMHVLSSEFMRLMNRRIGQQPSTRTALFARHDSTAPCASQHKAIVLS